MRTRFLPNFSTAYRVGKALGAASLLTLVIENHKNSKASSEQKNRVIKPLNHTFSYDLNSVGYTFKFDNNNTTILLPYSFDLDQYSKALRAALIAKQAYEDCGENSPVEFNIYFADSSNGNTYYYFNNKLVKNIFVHLYLDVKKANLTWKSMLQQDMKQFIVNIIIIP